MKQVKIAYEKCKAKMPHRPPDEIDFGLGFGASLIWVLEELEKEESFAAFQARLREELQ